MQPVGRALRARRRPRWARPRRRRSRRARNASRHARARPAAARSRRSGWRGRPRSRSACSTASSTPGAGRAVGAPRSGRRTATSWAAGRSSPGSRPRCRPGRVRWPRPGEPGAQRVVGHRQQPHGHAAPRGQRGGHRARAARRRRGARSGTDGWPGPGRPARNQSSPPEPAQLVHDRPGLAGDAPSGLAVVHAGQGVGDGVEVGADVRGRAAPCRRRR